MKRVNLNTKMHISAPCSSRGAETRAVAAAATFIDSISLCESERFFLKQRDFFFFSETNRSIKGEAGVGKRRRSLRARAPSVGGGSGSGGGCGCGFPFPLLTQMA